MSRMRVCSVVGVLITALAGCQHKPTSRDAAQPGAPGASLPIAPAPPVGGTPQPTAAPWALIIDQSGTHLSDGPLLVPLPADPSRGAGVEYKRHTPNDLYVVPVFDALKSARDAGRMPAQLPVIVHHGTPFRWLFETMFTATKAHDGAFLLCEDSCQLRSFEYTAPNRAVRDPSKPRLDLLALITEAGITIKTSHGNVAPGCASFGVGVAIPRRGGALDIESFATCTSKMKAANPAYAHDDFAAISASDATPFHEVMHVALALKSRAAFSLITLKLWMG